MSGQSRLLDNSVYAVGGLEEAISAYTKGLEQCIGSDTALLADRANCFNQIGITANQQLGSTDLKGRFDQAIGDLERCLDLGMSSTKLYFRLATNHFGLRKFEVSNSYLQKAIAMNQNDRALICFDNLLQRRLRESNGRYDWAQIIETSKTSPEVELPFADFSHHGTKIMRSENQGMGVFATEYIPVGMLILVEKAFAHESHDIQSREFTSLVQEVCTKMQKNPSTAAGFFRLFDGSVNDARKVPDSASAIMRKVEGILKHNSFGTQTGSTSKSYIWQQASYFNHRCVANVHRHFISDFIVMTTKADIKPGEELFINYTTTGDTYALRERRLFSFGFVCHCALCLSESQEPVTSKETRIKLLECYNEHVYPKFNSRAQLSGKDSMSLANDMNNIVRGICATYEESGREQHWYDLSKPGPALAVLQTELGQVEHAMRTWRLMIDKCNDGEDGSVGLYTALAALQYDTDREGSLETIKDVVKSWLIAGHNPTFVGYWTEMQHMWTGLQRIKDAQHDLIHAFMSASRRP